MNINTILGFLSVSAIVMSYAYLGVDDISAIEEIEDNSIGVSQVIEESCSDVITDTLEDNDLLVTFLNMMLLLTLVLYKKELTYTII